MKVAKHAKSNAIVLAKNKMTLSIGAGQMSRVVSTKIAFMKAEEEGLDVANCVLASDAFFPFRDNIDFAASKGVLHIIQPGGSIKDDEVIKAAEEKSHYDFYRSEALQALMKILVIGQGEENMHWLGTISIKKSKIVFVALGMAASTEEKCVNVSINVNDFSGIKKFIIEEKIDLL